MKLRIVLGAIFVIACFGALPAVAQGCGHHGHHCGDCDDCDHHGYSTTQPSRSESWAPSTKAAVTETTEGKIGEVIYLPGATEDSGMVEIRVQSVGQARVVRLAPTGFLKQGGLLLREGDAVKVKGFAVASMDGDILVATEITKGDKSLSLRDSRGRPTW
jgi:hypothetical protein